MASDSTAGPGAKRLALETLPPSKRSKQTNDDNAKMAWEIAKANRSEDFCPSSLSLLSYDTVAALAEFRRKRGKVYKVTFRGEGPLGLAFRTVDLDGGIVMVDHFWDQAEKAADVTADATSAENADKKVTAMNRVVVVDVIFPDQAQPETTAHVKRDDILIGIDGSPLYLTEKFGLRECEGKIRGLGRPLTLTFVRPEEPEVEEPSPVEDPSPDETMADDEDEPQTPHDEKSAKKRKKVLAAKLKDLQSELDALNERENGDGTDPLAEVKEEDKDPGKFRIDEIPPDVPYHPPLMKQRKDVPVLDEACKRVETRWEGEIAAMTEFIAAYGHSDPGRVYRGKVRSNKVPENLTYFAFWARKQYTLRSEGLPSQLTDLRIEQLSSIGFSFEKGGEVDESKIGAIPEVHAGAHTDTEADEAAKEEHRVAEGVYDHHADEVAYQDHRDEGSDEGAANEEENEQQQYEEQQQHHPTHQHQPMPPLQQHQHTLQHQQTLHDAQSMVDPVEAALMEARRSFLPPFDESAESAHKVYIAQNIAGAAWNQCSRIVETRLKEHEEGGENWIDALLGVHKVSESMKALMDSIDVSQQGAGYRIKTAFFLSLTLRFHMNMHRKGGSISGESLEACIKLCGVPLGVGKRLFELFTVPSEGERPGYMASKQLTDKRLVHILILYAIASGKDLMAPSINQLCKDMYLDTKKASNLLKEGGFVIKNRTGGMGISLPIPLKFPPPRRMQKK